MLQKHQDMIDGYANCLTKLANFLQKYNVPEFCAIMFPTFPDGEIVVYASLSRYDKESRHNEVLSSMGDAFGTDGWTSHQVSVTQFNWRKQLDGIRIDLDGARIMPEPQPVPVRPQDFPLQLNAPV